jgi:DNA-binding XRE family transcriptional regulator
LLQPIRIKTQIEANLLQFVLRLCFIFGVVNGSDKEVVTKAFGERLREVRKSKNLSQERLGHLIGLTVSQVGRIERGEINTSLMMIYNLAVAMGVHPYYLMMADFPDCGDPEKIDKSIKT